MKSVLIDVTFTGNGIVNFDDGKRQMIIMNALGIPGVNYKDLSNDNFKVGKHNYYLLPKADEDKKDKYGYKLLVSSDCLRNAIFGNAPTNDIMFNNYIFANYLTSESAICRGYTFLTENLGQFKRSSALTLSDAEQTDMNEAVNLMVNTRTGERDSTSLRYTEVIGEKEYHAIGKIELAKLAFISASPKFDRMAINPDIILNKIFDDAISKRYGEKAKVEKGYYSLKDDFMTIPCAEYGYLLNKEMVDYLTKWMLKNILKMEVNRAKATLRVKELKIKFVNDIFTDIRDDKEGWFNIASSEDIDALPIIYNDDIWVRNDDKDFTDFEAEVKEYKKEAKAKKASAAKTKKDNKKKELQENEGEDQISDNVETEN